MAALASTRVGKVAGWRFFGALAPFPIGGRVGFGIRLRLGQHVVRLSLSPVEDVVVVRCVAAHGAPVYPTTASGVRMWDGHPAAWINMDAGASCGCGISRSNGRGDHACAVTRFPRRFAIRSGCGAGSRPPILPQCRRRVVDPGAGPVVTSAPGRSAWSAKIAHAPLSWVQAPGMATSWVERISATAGPPVPDPNPWPMGSCRGIARTVILDSSGLERPCWDALSWVVEEAVGRAGGEAGLAGRCR